MAFPNPFNVPNASNSPYLQSIAGVGGQYNQLFGNAQTPLVDASGNLISAGQSQIGPGEFDPTVASLLATSQAPINTGLEDYFYNKYMADVNGRLGARQLLGQGVGEGLANDASRGYLAQRADTALGRQIAAGNAASGLRTGQVGRAASLTGAGLSPYDTLNNLLRGQGNVYGNAAELNNQTGISNARIAAGLTPTYLNLAGNALGALGKSAGSIYDTLTQPMSDSQIANVRDQGLTSDTSAGGGGGGGDSAPDISGYFTWARGGRIPGSGNYDHVRAILTPKEYVIRRDVAIPAKSALDRLNAGDFHGAARKLARVGSVAR